MRRRSVVSVSHSIRVSEWAEPEPRTPRGARGGCRGRPRRVDAACRGAAPLLHRTSREGKMCQRGGRDGSDARETRWKMSEERRRKDRAERGDCLRSESERASERARDSVSVAAAAFRDATPSSRTKPPRKKNPKRPSVGREPGESCRAPWASASSLVWSLLSGTSAKSLLIVAVDTCPTP
eukprot:958415-Rhodomonas_salina.2